MEVSPRTIQELANVINTASGAQQFTVMFFGALTVVALVWLVWVIIGIRLRPVDKLESKLEKLQEVMNDISKKMWSETTLNTKIVNEVNKAVLDHERKYHNQDNK